MSFASVSGSSIGQRLTYNFSGIDDGRLSLGETSIPLSIVPPRGTYILSTHFSIYSGSAISHEHSLQALCEITYDSRAIAKFRIDNQINEEVNMTGILFSDGSHTLELKISAAHDGEDLPASAWGHSSGSIEMVRLTEG